MKAFIDKVFKSKKLKKEKTIKEALQEADNFVQEKATEAAIEAIKVEPKQEVVKPKKPNHFPDCNCFKCLDWKRNA